MRALDQLSKFCATIAGGFTSARRSSGLAHDDLDRQRSASSPDGQPTARPAPAARDDRKQSQPSQGSHPAVWPR